MKKSVWRLSKLPSPSELTELVNSKILTHEEAKEILLKVETDEERDSDSLKEEIKFLRGLVDKLSDGNRSVVYEYIKTVPTYPWVQPYQVWCNTSNLVDHSSTLTTTNMAYLNGTVYSGTGGNTAACSNSFTDISTF